MSRELLNTLFVMTQKSYVRLDSDTLRIELDGKTINQVPVHHLGSVVLFGNVMISPGALARCAEDGRTVTFLDMRGRFKARLVGPTTGNILLRQAQYEAYADETARTDICRCIVAGKLQNSRSNLLRAARDCKSADNAACLRASAENVAGLIRGLPGASDVDEIRGYEGQGAAIYFEAFDCMIFAQRTDFSFDGRNRRPPRDRVNALLSFLYAVLANDCTSALEGVGLDPQMGYLHALRSGRPALSLDLMEEFRPLLAERLALTLINLKQIKADGFEERPGHSVMLNEAGRKAVIVAYQKRKQEEIAYPLLKTKVPLGLVPHLQARLLARCVRGEAKSYMPYMPR
jgi:CRISPR-associated protein Cas1